MTDLPEYAARNRAAAIEALTAAMPPADAASRYARIAPEWARRWTTDAVRRVRTRG